MVKVNFSQKQKVDSPDDESDPEEPTQAEPAIKKLDSVYEATKMKPDANEEAKEEAAKPEVEPVPTPVPSNTDKAESPDPQEAQEK